jgi:hypothetical protein
LSEGILQQPICRRGDFHRDHAAVSVRELDDSPAATGAWFSPPC